MAKASFLFTTSAVHLPPAPPTPKGEGEEGEEAEAAAEVAPVAEREPKRVLECLQRSLKIADACKVSSLSSLSLPHHLLTFSSPLTCPSPQVNAMHIPLFVEALDTYLLHYAAASPAITSAYISSLMQLIAQQLLEDGSTQVTAT